jgi:cobyrinic acid a,c-diamide synthase
VKIEIPRIILAAPSSGSGKTTVACGILQAFNDSPNKPMAFKCGPDYIDPMFHKEAMGLPSRNLDSFLLPKETLKYLFADNMERFLEEKPNGIAVIEGVMGFYDGLSGKKTETSTYDIARITETPVILIVDGGGISLSLAAVIKGFTKFKEDSNICGIILNRIRPGMYALLKEIVEEQTDLPVLGYMPEMPELTFYSRYLGLVTSMEVENIQEKLRKLGEQAKETIDLEGILRVADAAKPLEYEKISINHISNVRIGIARDEAFCFYYQDSLDLLEKLGAVFVPFSPLHDSVLPECDGLYIGGGYPEKHLSLLTNNLSMKEAIQRKIEEGLPCVAECGGFMYLLNEYQDSEGTVYEMAGVLEGRSKMTGGLSRFGYVTLTAKEDNLLCRKGDQINGHEFHYSDSDEAGESFEGAKPSGKVWNCIHGKKTIFAGYPHLHLWGNPSFGESFIRECQNYKSGRHLNEA